MTPTQKLIAQARSVGYTHAEIARLCSVRPATVTDWAKGRRNPLAELGPLLDELGVGTGPPRKQPQHDRGGEDPVLPH
jgi:transcriptional regulator with XRE-family HTH domain